MKRHASDTLRAAVAQFTVTREPERNLGIIDGFARDAAAGGARLLVLPEGLIARDGDDDGFAAAHAQPLDGPFVTGLRRISKEHGVALLGTVHVSPEPSGVTSVAAETATAGEPASPSRPRPTPRPASDTRVSNVFLAVDDGEIRAAYRKLHLYDAFDARESDVVRPGTELPPIVDFDGWKVGVMTCYDLRFPETARSLAARGADAVAVSAAWVRGALKERHWSLLAAARALENTCYVLACSEVGARNIGCSRIIDPMGETMAEADDDGPALIVADLSRETLASARRALPVLGNRRFADPMLRG